MSTSHWKLAWRGAANSTESDEFLTALLRGNHQIYQLERIIDGPIARVNACMVVRSKSPPETGFKCVAVELTGPAPLVASISRAQTEPFVMVIDVDSTLIRHEVIDVLAGLAGQGAAVAAITEQAMHGEIDFATALTERVRLLAGLPAAALKQAQNLIELQAGADLLISTLQAHGATIGLVSGGFSEVVTPLAESLGLTYTTANRLEIKDDRLTGVIEGPIVDRAGKAAALQELAERTNVPLANTVALGDGANDLDMIALANLGIAFNAKPVLRDRANATVDSPYLSDCLYVMGLSPLRAV